MAQELHKLDFNRWFGLRGLSRRHSVFRIVLWTICLSAAVPALGTDHCGQICSDETWHAADNPHLVTCSVEVCCDATLTIEPGVEVRFAAGTELGVGCPAERTKGTLIARGTAEAPIVFTSDAAEPGAGDWARIRFTDFAVDATLDEGDPDNVVYLSGSIMEHCEVAFAGGSVDAGLRAGLAVEQSRPYVKHCKIHDSARRGINIDGSLTRPQRIENCEIWNCAVSGNGGGIHLTGVPGQLLRGNYVHDCSASGGSGGGIFLAGESAHRVTGNRVEDCSASYGGGLYLNATTVFVEHNTLDRNSASYGGGAYFDSSSDGGFLTSNTVTENSASTYGGGLYFNDSDNWTLADNVVGEADGGNSARRGGGIYFRSSTGQTLISTDPAAPSTIVGNTASEDGGGVYFYHSGGSTLSTLSITDNTAQRVGGGVYLTNSANSGLTASEIRSNMAFDDGGGLYYYRSNDCELTLSDVTGNTAGDQGGGLLLTECDDFQMCASNVSGNFSLMGRTGGIWVGDGSQRVSLSCEPDGLAWGPRDPVVCNHICDNEGYDVNNANPFAADGSNDIDARGVCWCPEWDDEAVQNEIFDFFDDGARAIIVLSFNPNGLICTDTTYTQDGSPYLITQSILVACGACLTIEPGVTLLFDQALGLVVGSQAYGEGCLAALGDEGSEVILRPNLAVPFPGAWAGVTFTDWTVDAILDETDPDNIVYMSGSVLEHTIVEHAGSGRAAVEAVDSRPYLNHCEIRHAAHRGVSIEGSLTRPQRIEHCEIWDCAVNGNGGGIHLTGPPGQLLRGNYLHDCSASGGRGGGIFLAEESGHRVTGNRVEDCSASHGGGLYLNATTVFVEHNTLHRNSASYGGGAYFDSSSDGGFLTSNTVTENSASTYGGGLYFNDSDNWTLADNVVGEGDGGNGARRGGGIYFNSSTAQGLGSTDPAAPSTIVGNTASEDGGGVYFYHSGGSTLSTLSIADNTAQRYGGGVYLTNSGNTCITASAISSNIAFDDGGGLYYYRSNDCELTDNDVTDNTAGSQGGALRLSDCDDFQMCASNVSGNFSLTGRTGGIWVGDGSRRISLSCGPEGLACGAPDPVACNYIYDNEGCDVTNANPAGGDSDVVAECVYWATCDPAEIAQEICDCVDDPSWACVDYDPFRCLCHSEPGHEESLWRTQHNIVRLAFPCSAALPGPGEVLIQELLPEGQFGLDLSANFVFSMEDDGDGEGQILRIWENATSLNHRSWYAIRNLGDWAEVAPFEVHYVVQAGDANNNGRVQFNDLSFVNDGIPTDPAADDDRKDINGDGRVQFNDLSAANASIPSDTVPKPSGH